MADKTDNPLVHYMHVDVKSGELITIDVSQTCSPGVFQKAIDYLTALKERAEVTHSPDPV